MKYLKKFNEAVIIPDELKGDREIKSFDDLVEYGKENNFDVVEYDEFYASLKEDDQKTAPSKEAPFFALFHPERKKPMFVVTDKIVAEVFPIKDIVNNIIPHERIHQKQSERKNIKYKLPPPMDKKKYFSNKDEIMAFSWTIANDLAKKENDVKSAMGRLLGGRRSGSFKSEKLWEDFITEYCDEKVLKKYKKYIYLYLIEILNKNKDKT